MTRINVMKPWLGPEEVAAVTELRRDQENLLFALRTAAEVSDDGFRARRPDVVVRTFVGLAASWTMRGSEERAGGLAGTLLAALRGWPVPDEDVDVTAVALAFAMFAGVALCGTACGGSGDARPSTAQLETALASGPGTVLGQSISSVSADAPGCVAKVLHDSSLSDAVLRAIVDGHPDPTLGSAARLGRSPARDLGTTPAAGPWGRVPAQA